MYSGAEGTDKSSLELRVMSVNHNFCKCKEGENCSICSSPKGTGLSATLQVLLGKIDKLSGELASMNKDFNAQKQRIADLESNSRVSSDYESGAAGGVAHLLHQNKPARAGVAKAASKEVRVQEEKERTLELMREPINRGKVVDTTQTEDTVSDIFDFDELERNSMTKKDRSKHSRKTHKRQSKGRDISSEDNSELSSSSGAESSEIGGKHSR